MDEIKKTPEPGQSLWSRRKFIGAASAAAAGMMVVPRHVVGATQKKKAPSDTLNIACIGVGGMGFSDTRGVRSENIVALCDVDDEMMADLLRSERLEPGEKAMYEKAAKYRDFRRLLEKEKGVDAVTVTTPDHTHAVIAMAAIKLGKHVYVQKPLTHTIKEARLLAQAAKEARVTTQMGNQGHAGEGARLICEWIWDGAIGDVREVHCWTNRPIWPQGIDAPKEIPSVPSTVDWDVWLGPAPFRPYHPAYHPFKWRGLWDFGTGALGDMGAHIFDQPFWALKLKSPVSVQASSTPFTKDYYPWAEVVTYEFAAREGMGPLTLTWWDGGLMPPRPPELEPGRMMGDEGGGVLFRGDKGLIMCSVYGENPRLIPESRMQEYKRPEKTIPRSPGIREEWIEAIKKGAKSTTDFAYSGPLTEAMLLANVAVRLKDRNMKLLWDGEKMGFTNLPEADEFLHFEYRPGWSL
ncbi:MAG: Gfo/Idh/MocA family oxidoreductase [Candidatus Aminicenantes bacterium]|nr:Gfo/Idh/MocA family oxidoreductase [Candidatus Aminicenantes bacterium]